MPSQPRSPTSRVNRRKDARPSEIITAALQEFAQNGYAASRLDNVARRAGVVKGTIFRYFPGKEALFKAALTPQSEPLFDMAETMVKTFPGPTRDLISLLIQRIYHQVFTTDLHILMRIIISEGHNFPDISKLYFDQIISKGLGVIDQIITRGIEKDEFRNIDRTNLAIILISPLITAVVWKSTFEPFQSLDIENLSKTHIDLVLKGLGS